jgi:uncharacterized membrane protein YfcA
VSAYAGAGLALRMNRQALHRIIAILTVLIAAAVLLGYGGAAQAAPAGRAACGRGGRGAPSALSPCCWAGGRGGEFLIPTLVLLFGVDIKLAGSLSLAISLPIMLAGFARYSRDSSFSVMRANRVFVLLMAAGSVVSAHVGGRLLGVVPPKALLPGLALLLIVSAVKISRHR